MALIFQFDELPIFNKIGFLPRNSLKVTRDKDFIKVLRLNSECHYAQKTKQSHLSEKRDETQSVIKFKIGDICFYILLSPNFLKLKETFMVAESAGILTINLLCQGDEFFVNFF